MLNYHKHYNSKRDLGQVAVLKGGWSSEREISLAGGALVYQALQKSLDKLSCIDVNRHNLLQLEAVDMAFNIVHGKGGEDGVLQSVLELKNIAYTGSGVMACAIAMDKLRTKMLWQAVGLPTPEWTLLTENSALDKLEYPLMVKPVAEGSSIGMCKVNNRQQIEQAIVDGSKYGACFAERYIGGKEYTIGILNGQCLPIIELKVQTEFYDYAAKYQRDDTQYICPCDLSSLQQQELNKLAIAAFNAVGAHNWGRVDLLMDEKNNPYLIEINTVPGMSEHSLLPMAAAAVGLDYSDLVLEILHGAAKERSYV